MAAEVPPLPPAAAGRPAIRAIPVAEIPALNVSQCGDITEGGALMKEKVKEIKWLYDSETDSMTCGDISVSPAGLQMRIEEPRNRISDSVNTDLTAPEPSRSATPETPPNDTDQDFEVPDGWVLKDGVMSINTPPFNQLKIDQGLIGKGRFATVRRAKWKEGSHKEPTKESPEKAAAKDESKKPVMAVKRYNHPDNGREKTQGVEYEVQMFLHPINHQNVVKYINMFCFRHEIYVLMEYANRGDLQTLIQRHGPLSAELNMSIAFQLLHGLQALHNAGFIHRDLKLSDILFDHHGTVKLANFCIAKYRGDGGTQCVTTCLDWLNASPEQIKREAYTVKVDIFSFGLLMAFCACGFHPLTSRRSVVAQLEVYQNQLQANNNNGGGGGGGGEGAAAARTTLRLTDLMHRLPVTLESAAIDFPLLRFVRGECFPASPSIDAPQLMENLIERCLCETPSRRPSCAELLQDDLFNRLEGEQCRAQVRAWLERIRLTGNGDFGVPAVPQVDVFQLLLQAVQ